MSSRTIYIFSQTFSKLLKAHKVGYKDKRLDAASLNCNSLKHCIAKLWESNHNRYGVSYFIFAQKLMHEIFISLMWSPNLCCDSVKCGEENKSAKILGLKITLCMFVSQRSS